MLNALRECYLLETTMYDFQLRDAFLSEEDLDVQNMEWNELVSFWNNWLSMMQATNEEDQDDYSHGVFLSDKQKRELWGANWEEEVARMLKE